MTFDLLAMSTYNTAFINGPEEAPWLELRRRS